MSRGLLSKFLQDEAKIFFLDVETTDNITEGLAKFVDAAQKAKIDSVATGADVTNNAAIVAADGLVKASFAGAHSLLATQGTIEDPASIDIPVSTLVGRASTGNIIGLDATAIKTLLALVSSEIANNSGVSGATISAALDQLSLEANNIQAGIFTKQSVDAVTTVADGNQNLAFVGASVTIDGVTSTATVKKFLLTQQTVDTENGSWVFTNHHGWARSADSDGNLSNEVQAGTSYFALAGGTVNGSKRFTQYFKGTGIDGAIIVGTDDQNFTETSDSIPLASSSTNGLLSIAGFDKLAAIEAGATADQTAAEVSYSNTAAAVALSPIPFTPTDSQAAIDALAVLIRNVIDIGIVNSAFTGQHSVLATNGVASTPGDIPIADKQVLGRLGGNIQGLSKANLLELTGMRSHVKFHEFTITDITNGYIDLDEVPSDLDDVQFTGVGTIDFLSNNVTGLAASLAGAPDFKVFYNDTNTAARVYIKTVSGAHYDTQLITETLSGNIVNEDQIIIRFRY